jgi:hypothetical protein
MPDTNSPVITMPLGRVARIRTNGLALLGTGIRIFVFYLVEDARESHDEITNLWCWVAGHPEIGIPLDHIDTSPRPE